MDQVPIPEISERRGPRPGRRDSELVGNPGENMVSESSHQVEAPDQHEARAFTPDRRRDGGGY